MSGGGGADSLIGQNKANWKVILSDEAVNVIPLRGTEHKMSPDCWCFPRVEQHVRALIVHNEAN